ncbi:MAG: hypoxanthine phosphoribosyltransferase [Flavobacteriaceae bacterium]
MSEIVSRGRRIEVLFSADELARRNAELAAEIARDVGTTPLVIAILKGSFIFAADLIRALHGAGVTPEVEFMGLSSYRAGTQSSGAVSIVRDIETDVTGRRIVLIDDILESGRTIAFARDLLIARGASSVHACVLLDKPGKRAVEFEADFVGFPCPDRFVVGYGMDVGHAFRELPFVGVVASD